MACGVITTELREAPNGLRIVPAFAKLQRTKDTPENYFLPSRPVRSLWNSAPFGCDDVQGRALAHMCAPERRAQLE